MKDYRFCDHTPFISSFIKSHYRLFLIGDAKAYSILYWDANLGSNLISGGDFESGWDSYWNAPTSYEIVDHKDGSAIHIISGVLSQEFDTEDNELYLITADLLGDVALQVIENDYVESPLAAMSYANNFSAWTKVVTLFKGKPLVIGIRWVLEVAAGAGGAYIDNVKVQKITFPVGFVKSAGSGEITIYGKLVDKTGNSIGGGGGGSRIIQVLVTSPLGDVVTTGDGKAMVRIPAELNGYNLTAVAAHVTTVSSSGTPTIQLRNVTDSVDMLSTPITIDANEKDSKDAATAAVIDTAYDDVVTGDEIAIDVDVPGTGTKGLIVEMTFEAP